MNIEKRVHDAVADRVESVVPPPADVDAVVGSREGRSKVRVVAIPVAAAAMVTGVVGGSAVWLGEGGDTAQAGPLGQFDFSNGLRAYMSPDADGKIHIAGREFNAKRLEDIDTAATATAFGMVYFNAKGQAHLLDEAGYRKAIGPVPDSPPDSSGPAMPTLRMELKSDSDTGNTTRTFDLGDGKQAFRPSAQADASRPLVAWTEPDGDHVTVRMYDLANQEAVGTYDVPCDGQCADVEVVAVDDGVAYVSTSEGTYAWTPGSDQWNQVAGPETDIIDVANETILYNGTRPTTAPRWSLVKGSADSQLSDDGRYVLDRSARLRPVHDGDKPVLLDLPANTLFFAFDTDGSVLAATGGNSTPVYDCEIPSGSCEQIGGLTTATGDPIFIGTDN